MDIRLQDLIGYDYRTRNFVLSTHDKKGNTLKASVSDQARNLAAVNEYLARFATGAATREERLGLIAAITEPINTVVDYTEMYDIFFTGYSLAYGEDPHIPIENIVVMAWETHEDAAVLFTRPGYSWARPDFKAYDTGVEIQWATMARAGWNVLARAMQRAAMALARKRDERRRGVLNAAVLGSHDWTVTGGLLTKASVDAILKAQVASGFPVTQVLVNGATIMDMGAWTWATAQLVLPEAEVREVLQTLHFMNYGNAQWYTNINAPAAEVWFSGPAGMIGYEVTRGESNSASDIDIVNKVDRHAVYDKEYAYYVANALPLARLRIAA